MSFDHKSLEEMIDQLPADSRAKVRNLVEYLFERNKALNDPDFSGKKLRQTWAGALSDYREQYSSLELQKKALEWRGD